MEVFSGFIFLALAVIALIFAARAYTRAKNTHLELTARITKLEKRLEKLTFAINPPAPQQEKKQSPVVGQAPKAEDKGTVPKSVLPALQTGAEPGFTYLSGRAEPAKTVPKQTPPAAAVSAVDRITLPSREKPAWLKTLEKRFLENWLGILGAIVLVIGLSILGLYLYTLIPDSAVIRFGLLVAASGLLLGCFFLLQTRTYWKELALWLRSSAAAVFLFACFASGGVPGLQWITAPLPALLLLCTGIVANLLLAFTGGRQTFASLHVCLSLVSIAIAPQSETTFIIATVITLFGVILTYREKWEYHLFLTITCFFIYIIYWYFSVHPEALMQKILAFTGILLVNGLAAFTHYRKIYHALVFNPKSFLIHVANWCFLGIGLYLYAPRFTNATVMIGLAAVAVFLLARQAKKHQVRWLYVTDTVMAQIIAYVAILSLSVWKVQAIPIISVIYLETLLFSGIMLLEKEKKLAQWGIYVSSLGNLYLAVLAFLSVSRNDTVAAFNNAFVLFISAAATQVFTLVTEKKRRELYASDTDKTSDTNKMYCLCEKRQTSLVMLFCTGGLALLALALQALHPYVNFTGLPVYVLLLPGALGLLASRNCFTKKIHYTVDILAAQFIAIVIFFSLSAWQIPVTTCLSIAIGESALFAWIHLKKENMEVHVLGYCLLNIGLAFLLIFVLKEIIAGVGSGIYWSTRLAIVGGLLPAGFYYFLYTYRKTGEGVKKRLIAPAQEPLYRFNNEALGCLITGLLASLFLLLNHMYTLYGWFNLPFLDLIGPFYYILPFVLAALYFRQKSQTRGLAINGAGITLYLFIFGLHVYCWFSLYKAQASATGNLLHTLIYYLPLPVISLLTIQWSHWERVKGQVKWFGIYLAMLHISILIYFLFQPVSSLLPGIGWLLLSLIALEISHRIGTRVQQSSRNTGRADFHYLLCGYLLIPAFLYRHLLVHLQSEQYLGLIKVRLIIEILALGVFCYWFVFTGLRSAAAAERREGKSSAPGSADLVANRSANRLALLQPLFLELILLFGFFTILVETNPASHPLFWIGAACLLLYLSRIKQPDLSRLQLYSVFLFFASIIHVTFISSPYLTGHYRTFDWQWFLAVLAILLQAVYIVLFYRLYKAETIRLPFSRRFSRMIVQVDKKKNLWIFYPMLASIALFLIWSFDSSLLTLLLTGEAFLIFIISLALRENHFRYLSMLWLLVCLVRLVGFDLANAHTVAKALVCIGMAVIMLAMNALYNRFKQRYERNENEK